ncbi:MAG: hypothetical protein AAGK98_05345 [Pseudomonadota bacterium]
MRSATYFIAVSAALHGVGCILSGFSAQGLFMLLPALLFAGLWVGLTRGIRGMGWISLFLMIGSAAAALSNALSPSTVPDGVFWAILMVNIAAAGALFAAIWRGPTADAANPSGA